MRGSLTRRRFLGLAGAVPLGLSFASACGSGQVGPAVVAGGVATPTGNLAPAAVSLRPAGNFGAGPVAAPLTAADQALQPKPGPGRAGFALDAYRGLGCWIDVFDWSVAYTGGAPLVGPAEVAALAGRGVRTIYLQTARYDRPDPGDDLLELDRLRGLADAAHGAGMAVVAWYLPLHVNEGLDRRRVLAALQAPFVDGMALDIESRAEPDVALRNARLAALVAEVRAAAGPQAALGAIVVPPTTMEDVNPNFWPGFDWAMLAQHFDVFLPMNYWTNRLADSPWRQAGASTAENIRRLQDHGGRADFPVHVVGGIANLVTPAEVSAMVAAAVAGGAWGGSLYDLATTGVELWPALQGLTR